MKPPQKFQRFLYKHYIHVLAFIFAIEEINRNPLLLPNVSLGYHIYNSYHSHQRTLEGPVLWLSGGREEIPNYNCESQSKSVAVVEGITSAFVLQLGTLLELYKFPQISYGLFDPLLSDKELLPSLYQMSPKDSSLALGMVKLLLHFSWTWVGLIVSDDMKGEQFLWELKEDMAREGVCAAFTEKVSTAERFIPFSNWVAMPNIDNPSINVTVVYGDTDALTALTILIMNSLDTWKVWITTYQWDFTTNGEIFLLNHFHGTLILSKQSREIPGFRQFLETVNPSKYPEDIFLKKLWLFSFDCSLSGPDCETLEDCPLNASVASVPLHYFDMSTSDFIKTTYDSVYSVAHALHEVLLLKTQVESEENANPLVFYQWQLHQPLRVIQFTNSIGDQVTLDENRNCVAQYDILNYCNLPSGLQHLVKVGKFVPQAPHGQELTIHKEIIDWAIGFEEAPLSVCSTSCGPGFRKTPQEEKAVCCFNCITCPGAEISNMTDSDDCTKCPDDQYPNSGRNRCLPKAVTFLAYEDPLGTALASVALCFSALTAVVLGVFVKHRHTPIVKANNRTLSYILLISLFLCFLCSLLFIGRPNTATCILRQIIFGIMFTVVVSTILAKTITVLLAFKATTPGRKTRWFWGSRISSSVIFICFFIQATLSGIWLGIAPPFIDIDAHSEYGHLIIECNKGSVIAFYCALGFMGSLALVSFILAFLARNLPDTFNEAKFLTFSMLMFCSVWITFLPVYHSSKGKVMVAVEIFSILTSSAGILGCIFAPKCYIILIRPDRNTLQGLREKTKFSHL
ncbi:PREDICTED: vomeronasal type-2 receptor 116-like [Miniopterus natalensis]|uniref:vomeronasal type-2 receptor 116-like n=1 Tax=Miniopterus natalensis TaxID=291302 RepID=UPI0007A6CB5A|nr:PREDICTED: vomeronasal type-2 receptor 116-like [Miniopterus natalensis]